VTVSAADFSKEESMRPNRAGLVGTFTALFHRLRRSESNAVRALMIYGLRIVGAGLIFLAQIVIARWLDPTQYGVFANIWVAFILLGGWASLGLGGSMIRFVPEYTAQGRQALLRGLRRTGRAVGFVFAIVIGVVGYAALQVAGDAVDPAYHGPIVLALVAMPFYAMSDVNDGLCRGYGWPIRGIAPNYILRPILMIVAVVAAELMIGMDATATSAMAAVAVAFAITIVVQTVITESGVRGVLPEGKADYAIKSWLAVSLPLLLTEGMLALMGYVDVLLVGAMRGAEEVGLYYAATRVVALVAFVPYAVIAVFGPRFSASNAVGDVAALRDTASQALTLSLWPSFALAIGIGIVGPLLLMAFGAEFVSAYDALLLLLVAALLRAAVAPAQTMLAMTGHHSICVVILALALGANVVLNLVLIPVAGLVGAALATAIAVGFEIVLSVIVIKQRFGFVPRPDGDLRRFLSIARAMIAARAAAKMSGPEA